MAKIIGMAADHAGYELKEALKPLLNGMGYEVKDFGTHSTESMDYPDVAHPLAEAVEKGEVCCGVAMCGSANGISMSLNKHQGVRAAICWKPELASLAIFAKRDIKTITFCRCTGMYYYFNTIYWIYV